jgi:hypothetical protein
MVDEPKITLKVRLDSIFQMISNKVTSWSQTPSNDKYPSEKLVKNSLDGKVDKVTGKGLSTNDFTGYYKGMIDGLSEVATTGDYNDLDNIPLIPTYTSQLSNDGDGGDNKYVVDNIISDVAKSGSYSDLTNKPSYTPTITSSTTGAYKIGSINVSGSNVDIYGKDIDTVYTHPTYSNVAKSTSAIYKFKTNSLGHIIEISTVSASDLPSHNHDDRYYTESEVNTALNGKANSTHTHKKSQITDFPSIPSKTSDLQNDSGFLTTHQSLSNYYNKSETNNYDVDFILGTQTASTSAWTGTTDVISSLREGTTIFYKLPYASTSTNVTLNLTLKGGGTTGAKNVFYKNTSRVTTHFGVGQVVGLTYDGTAWYVISPSDNNSNNDNNYGGIQFKAGEALTTQTICCAKNNGQYYKVANGVVLDIRYPLIMTSSAVASGTTTNTMYRTWYGVNIANTKSMTLTNGSQLFLEGTAYSDGKFTISSNVVTHTLTNGRYYIKVGTALSTTQIRFISDMTVYYYNGTTLKPVIKKEQIVDFPTIPDVSGKEDKSNKVTSISSSSTDTQYPSAKAVYDLISLIYPIGSIYMSVNSTDPSTFLGGTWEQIQDRFLLASGSTYTGGSTGGSATVSLSASQMPRHNHSTNSHYHNTNTSGEYFVTSEASGANNTRVAYSSSGSRYVDGMNDNKTPFHHRSTTDSQAPSTKYTGGTGSTEAYSNGSAHENMPPYLAVYMWKRVA